MSLTLPSPYPVPEGEGKCDANAAENLHLLVLMSVQVTQFATSITKWPNSLTCILSPG